MTTLKDLLLDLAHEIHENTQIDTDGKTYIFTRDEEDIVDEYIEEIKERLIG
jgi:hypothetical protein